MYGLCAPLREAWDTLFVLSYKNCFNMKLDWGHWLYSLGKTVIGGVAATVTAWLGTLAGNQITAEIKVLDWQQLGFILLFSTLTNLFFFLQKSPLPQDLDQQQKG